MPELNLQIYQILYMDIQYFAYKSQVQHEKNEDLSGRGDRLASNLEKKMVTF